eukprot:2681575-Pyramimonas_sp.AAC.1
MSADGGKYSAINPIASDLVWKLAAAHRPHDHAGVGYIRFKMDLGNLELSMRMVMPHDAVTYALRLSPNSITQVLSIRRVSFICPPYELSLIHISEPRDRSLS